MHARSKGVSADVLDRSARAPRVGAHALRVDAAKLTADKYGAAEWWLLLEPVAG